MCDLKGVEIHDLAGLSEPLTKLIETVSNAIGKVCEPFHIRRMAKAKAQEISLISSTINNNPQLPIKYNDGQVVIDATNANELVQRAQTRFLYQEMKQQQNIESVIGNAYNELESVSSVSSDPVDNDWITRLFQIVKDISSEEMQIVWGKILAGEIVQPGSFSLRTLDIIRNLTQQEAEVFQRIMPFVMHSAGGDFITSSSDILSQFDIKYEYILRLDECGLLNSNSKILMGLFITNTKPALIYNKEILIHILGRDVKKTQISFGIYALTRAGYELYKILNYAVNKEYSFSVAKEIFQENEKAKVSVFKINSISGKTINFDENPLRIFGDKNGEFL